MSDWPFVSIVIPAFNAAGTIEELLTSLLALDYPADCYEIIVVDNGSSDDTCQIVQKYPVKLLEEREIKGSAASRNKGIKSARGEIIAFTDADCIADRHWLKMLLAGHPDPTVGGFIGDLRGREPAQTKVEQIFNRSRSNSPFQFVKSPDGTRTLTLTRRAPIEVGKRGERWTRWGLISYYKRRPSIPLLHWAPTPNVAYRRTVFEEIGFFDVGLLRASDIDFAWRMQLKTNYRFYATPEAIIYHKHPTTLNGAIKHRYKGGLGKLFILDKYLGLDRRVRREVILESSLDLIITSSLALGSLIYRCLRIIARRNSDPLYLTEALLNLFGNISQDWGRIQACLKWEQIKKYAYQE